MMCSCTKLERPKKNKIHAKMLWGNADPGIPRVGQHAIESVMKNETKKTNKKRSSGYLVATFENFPRVKIPLLSESECRARGIEPGKLPPIDAWSPEQRAAFKELAEVIVQVVVDDIFRSSATRPATTTAA